MAAAIDDIALDVTDSDGLVEVCANAGLLAKVVAYSAQRARQRVVRTYDFLRVVDVVIADSSHVLGYLLLQRAHVDTRSPDAVERAKRTVCLAAGRDEFGSHVVRIGANYLGVAPKSVKRPVEVNRYIPDSLDVVEQSQVATGFQQVRAYRDGLHTGLEQLSCVIAARSGRE